MKCMFSPALLARLAVIAVTRVFGFIGGGTYILKDIDEFRDIFAERQAWRV
jgi:hypothetical protein